MPSKKKVVIGTEASLPQIPPERLGRAATGPVAAGAAESVMRGFKKAVVGRVPGAGMSHRPGCRPGTAKPGQLAGHRNGRSGKTALAGDGSLRIGVPRGRDGSSGTHPPASANAASPALATRSPMRARDDRARDTGLSG
ncbi:MAG: hypothetical protein HY777_04400 [Betaproteobacteria bacterium]|nr:hypothetical protein [Betaproteobacteria bacterium]